MCTAIETAEEMAARHSRICEANIAAIPKISLAVDILQTRERMLRELMSDLANMVEAGDMTDMEANEWYNMKADQWAEGLS
jgi:hypothetical protein